MEPLISKKDISSYLVNNNNILSYKNELYRKIIHICSIIFPITYYFTTFTFFSLFILSSTVILLIIDFMRKKSYSIESFLNIFLNKVYRQYEKNELMSASYMFISFSFITFMFNKPEVIFGMLIVIFSDSIAALIGIKYGKILIINNKTLEGSFSFIIATITILILMNFDLQLYELLIISFSATLTELITPTRYDNFTIPITSSLTVGAFI